ncbi:MAG: c-type cytochrome, partial [Verrucomicrobiota bacterium]
ARSITHFLVSLHRGPAFQPTAPDQVAAEKGEALFHDRGCVACHAPRSEDGEELLKESSVPLGALEEKYQVKSLIDFIRRPHAVRPSGRMPDMRLQGRDLERIAHYLLKKTEVPGHLRYTVLRGRVWEGLDAEVEKEKSGHADRFDLAALGRVNHNTSIRFEGFLNLAQPGRYRFFLEMNGGRLLVGGNDVVKLGPTGRRGPKKVQGDIELTAGWHAIDFTYVHAGKEPRLLLEMEGPGFRRGPIPSNLLSISTSPIEPYEPLEVDNALAEQGRAHFTRLGCVKCHDDVRVTTEAFPALADLNKDKTCSKADYKLSPEQNRLLSSAVKSMGTISLSDVDVVNKTLVSLNCIACHERDGLGGVAPERNHYFTGGKPELGNQGRIPPPLTHVGAKLDKEWIHDVLLKGRRQRNYLNATMPQYGESHVGHLIDLFEKVDKLEPAPLPDVTDLEALKTAGHRLMGTEGLSCIACHDFNGQKSGGAGALELIHTTDRIKKNWFHLYMRQPSRFHQTVIMPTYWPGGVALREDILGGDTAQQIEALWVYLEDGIRAKNPKGLSRQSSELRVTDVAVMCRGRGSAGYRGIAVGYPERVSLAFDSE